MALNFIHGRLSNTVFLYFLAMMVWALWRYFRQEGVSSSFRGALVISEILILIQGVLGVVIWFSGVRPEGGSMHILYGVVGAIGVPLIYTFTRARENRVAMLSFAAVYFCLLLIVLRSAATG